MARAFTGISGWTYDGWRGVFYPDGLARRRELEYASRQLNAIEINGTFYSLQRPSSFEQWHQQTPRGFRFAVKASRFITHMKQLRDVEVPLANFLASGELGPLLWQSPRACDSTRRGLRRFWTCCRARHPQLRGWRGDMMPDWKGGHPSTWRWTGRCAMPLKYDIRPS
jgi:uncharacterized protein YecE (DUF72 family)